MSEQLSRVMSNKLNSGSEDNSQTDSHFEESVSQTLISLEKIASSMTPIAPISHKIETEVIPTLQNIVSTVNLAAPLHLRKMALLCRNSEYNPKRLNALIMRIREPRTTALIFASGKMVCTGARDEEQARLSSRKFARIVQKLGYEVKFLNFKIHNIVASCDLGFNIHLEALSIGHRNYCSYEAEIFPGLIYHMVEPKIVLLIFVSGKIVLTGAKERHQIFDGFKKILPVLKLFAKDRIKPPAPIAPTKTT